MRRKEVEERRIFSENCKEKARFLKKGEVIGQVDFQPPTEEKTQRIPHEWKRLLGKANRLNEAIERHNHCIEEALIVAKRFKALDKFSEPERMDEDELTMEYGLTVSSLKHYSALNEELRRFVEEYDDFIEELPEIRRQHALLESFSFTGELEDRYYRKKDIAPFEGVLDLKRDFYGLKELASGRISDILSHNHDYVSQLERPYLGVFCFVEEYMKDPLTAESRTELAIGAYQTLLPYKGLLTEEGEAFVEAFSSIKDDLSAIREQFLLKCELNAAFASDAYIDSEERRSICEHAHSLSCQTEKKDFYHLWHIFPELSQMLDLHNEQYVSSHMNELLFTDIGGHPLDDNQKKAALTDERRVIVIAGAGSGKTTTIVGKVRWLLHSGVSAEDILLLSYSRDSAEELSERMKKNGLSVKASTIHALGLEVLQRERGGKLSVDTQFEHIIESYFLDELPKQPKKFAKIITYSALFMHYQVKNEAIKDRGAIASLKQQNLATLKDKIRMHKERNAGQRKTFRNEIVKSDEELIIANYYFLNGIDYEYEPIYKVNGEAVTKPNPLHRAYHPDFYLPEYGVYHEHYGISRDGRCRQYGHEEEEKYIAQMKWKRFTHSMNHTKCIETYSWQFAEESIFEALDDALIRNGIEKRPLSDETIANRLRFIIEGKEFRSFIKLVSTFIALYKSNYADEMGFAVLREKAKSYGKRIARSLRFLEIAEDAYVYYRGKLNDNESIDFDDMILRSTKALPNDWGHRYSHIIVDEFQDISKSRFEFISALAQHGHSKLFVVGDDWQSIYRFAGSDVSLFTDFAKSPGAKALSIDNVYRNSSELQAIMSPFMMRNQSQIKKCLIAHKSEKTPISIVYYRSDEPIGGLSMALNDIFLEKPDADVLLLGRNNFDIEPFMQRPFSKGKNGRVRDDEHPSYSMAFKTVHRSKGLEADYVILLNAKDAVVGFPNRIEDDQILNLLLAKPESFPCAEERRLFYVALTRAKRRTYILLDPKSVSPFVKEIQEWCHELNPEMADKGGRIVKCPHCHEGHIVHRDGFYGCSEYPYCDYKISEEDLRNAIGRCPLCGDFIVKRYSKMHNRFFGGCHSYPYCSYTTKMVHGQKKGDK